MNKDEALDLALETLESIQAVYPCETVGKRITAIKQALAAPVQKMVANMTVEDGRISFAARILADGTYDLYTTPIYAVPFQRKPLTEEDILECWKQAYEPGRREHDNAIRMARAIEAKFKERTQ